MDNYETLPLQPKVNRIAQARAAEAIASTGRALPCSVTAIDATGALVTVQFECTYTVYQGGEPVQVTLQPLTLPKAESQWCRIPTQVGDFGITVPADTYLGMVSGQSTAVADLDLDYGNLSTLVFVPVASVQFPASPNINKAWVNGTAGVRIGDPGSGCYVDVDLDSQTVTIKAAGLTWTFGSAGLTMSDSIVAETHVHSGITTGGNDTLGPKSPP